MPDIINEWQSEPLGRAILRRVRAWLHLIETQDPWPQELDEKIHSADALPVCHRCFRPFEYYSNTHFCADCGAAVGPYNNSMPFIYIYSIGEVMRSGVGPEAVLTIPCLTGYVLFMFAQSTLLFPFLIFRLCRNISRLKTVTTETTVDRRVSSRLIIYVLCLCALLVLIILNSIWPNSSY